MACCCTKILELCRVSVCGTDQIDTGIDAPATGVYKLILDYLKTEVVISKAIEIGTPLVFPSNDLNERYKYRGKIIGPDGEPLTITIDEDEYDCITFQTGMQYPMNEVTCPAIDTSSWSVPDATLGVPYYVELPINGSEPYKAEFISQPGWMGLAIVGNKLVLSGTPDIEDTVELQIKVSNCANALGLAPDFVQQITTNPAP